MKKWLLVVMAACGASKGVVDPSLTSNSVPLAWHATQGGGQTVDVTLDIGGKPYALGALNAAADDAPSTCTLRKAEATVTEFSCGATPSYNYFVAELKDGQVIVSLVTGVADDPNSEERKVVQRVDSDGTMFAVAPWTAPKATSR